jgi:retron-type reverse transcriptase
MYVATKEDTRWLQNVQRALHTRSKEHLGIAFVRVQRNRGARTAGIDRVTVRKVLQSGVMSFRQQANWGSFVPWASRPRKMPGLAEGPFLRGNVYGEPGA